MSEDAAEAVRLLLLSRDYDAAIAAARAAPPLPPGERSRLERMALARRGNFNEAAAAGRAVVASGRAEPEDCFRLAEILLRCGQAAAALEIGLAALRQCPAEARYVVPVVQAVLLDPALEPALRAGLALLTGTGMQPKLRAGRMVNLPVDLPHYLPFDGPHPWVMGLVGATADEIDFTRQSPQIEDLAAAILAALPRALALTAQLTTIHPLVGRAEAAAYIAHRFPAGLYGTEGAAIDLLPFLPLTLADRPFVLVFDFIGNIFSPPQPFEDTEIDPRRTPIYWILRAALQSAACAAIVTNYLEVGPLLGGFFGSPEIAAKCVFVNPVYSVDESGEQIARHREIVKAQDSPITLLFTASVNWRDEGFYVRGGVDVLNAFLDLAERYPQLHLVFRSRLPPNLSARLSTAVRTHPRIRWLGGFLPWDAYHDILTTADLFLMPSVALYRNGLVQAMRWGIVPVIADCMHAHEVLDHGMTGLVVAGRGHRAAIAAADQSYRGDWVDLLRATDRPADRRFYERYRETLDALITAPERIAEMRVRLLTQPSRHRYGPDDRDRFAATLKSAIDRAADTDLTPSAVFPVQPRHRPGDPIISLQTFESEQIHPIK